MEQEDLYTDARRYDLVMGRFASSEMLAYYRRQVARFGQPVLELGCGSGRLAIPLAEEGVEVVGLDLSEQMLELAAAKARERGVGVSFVRGDIRDFDLGRSFPLVIIPAQSLSHLYVRRELEECLACVRHHLEQHGTFLIELFNPSVELLARDPDRLYEVRSGAFASSEGGAPESVTTQVRYDSAAQVSEIRYFYRRGNSRDAVERTFRMRLYFPQEIDALLAYNGFEVVAKHGGYNEERFSSESAKQLIACKAC